MEISFGDEHLKLSKGENGVYKIIFDEKWFYFGSSVDLKRRLSAWKHNIRKREYKKNRSIHFILPEVASVRFEIVENIKIGISPKSREDFFIKKHFDNPLCLNLIPDAINGKGRKLPLGVVKKEKLKRGLPSEKKPVALFDKNGVLIKKYYCTGAAAKEIQIPHEEISDYMKGKRGAFRNGTSFKYVAKDGSFIEPVKYVDKKIIGRKVLQFDKQGNFIAEHISVMSVSKLLKGSRRNLTYALNGRNHYKTFKGYVFKYADEM